MMLHLLEAALGISLLVVLLRMIASLRRSGRLDEVGQLVDQAEALRAGRGLFARED